MRLSAFAGEESDHVVSGRVDDSRLLPVTIVDGISEGGDVSANHCRLVAALRRPDQTRRSAWTWFDVEGRGDCPMGRRDMRLPAPVLILPSWFSRHQVELVNGHGQVSGTHRRWRATAPKLTTNGRVSGTPHLPIRRVPRRAPVSHSMRSDAPIPRRASRGTRRHRRTARIPQRGRQVARPMCRGVRAPTAAAWDDRRRLGGAVSPSRRSF